MDEYEKLFKFCVGYCHAERWPEHFFGSGPKTRESFGQLELADSRDVSSKEPSRAVQRCGGPCGRIRRRRTVEVSHQELRKRHWYHMFTEVASSASRG